VGALRVRRPTPTWCGRSGWRRSWGSSWRPPTTSLPPNRYGQFSNGHRARSPRPHLCANTYGPLGLIPSWAKDRKIGSRLINARAETITEKPSFKAAASRRRCIVPADGYFEWERRDGAKVPHYLHGDGVLGMAGLYELWPDPEREPDDPQRWVWTITVLTTTASDALGHIHDRSPVVIPPALQDAWLDPTLTDSERVRELLDSVPEPRLQPYEVSTAVNSVRNNSAELLSPV